MVDMTMYLVFVMAHRVGDKITYCPHLWGLQEGIELDVFGDYMFDKDDSVEEDYYAETTPQPRLFSSESNALRVYSRLTQYYLSKGELRYEEYEIRGQEGVECLL